MANILVCTAFTLASIALGQQIGTTPEVHPELITQTCTTKLGCVSWGTSVVLDSQWRNIEDVYTGESCIEASGKLNNTICPTAEECARRCALDGADYEGTGVEARGDSVTLHMYQKYRGNLIDVQPQVYLLYGGDYAMLQLLNQEVSFDVDVSNLPCGMNGAAYLIEMDSSGGRSALNPAGATYGTGYCDSECYKSYNFVNGVANVGYHHGTCCNEMDLWEANSISNQLTAHPCNHTGLYACTGEECFLGNRGPCDRTGCGFNPYGLGAHNFYGHQGIVDTKKPFTVITQFPTDDGTIHGTLTEIRRLYVQNGKLIHNAIVKFNRATFDSIDNKFCEATVPSSYHRHGGIRQMGEALKRGMALVLGIWNDPSDFNTWLDSGSAGPCNRTEGSPANIKANHPSTSIKFSNIRWGDIGSTFENRVSKGAATSGISFKDSASLFIALLAAYLAINLVQW